MIVMKFGGTSVESAVAIRRAAEIVRRRLAQRPVVVVSAMGGVTDRLLSLGHAAAGGAGDSAAAHFQALCKHHREAGRELAGVAALPDLGRSLDAHFHALEQVQAEIAAAHELSAALCDRLLAFGELLSCEIVTAALAAAGLDSVRVDARECIVTNAEHTRAVPNFAESKKRLLANLGAHLVASRVPVLGGFIASTLDGVPTTLGRGGSDFSAAIIGAALGARCIEIWTDVPGIMTTDPGICPRARLIHSMSFAEAAEIAYFGAKVLHPATLLPAAEANVPVVVLNSRNPEGQGTRISAHATRVHTTFRAIAARRGVTIVNVAGRNLWSPRGFLRSVFTVFDRHNCAVDAVATTQASLSLAVDSGQLAPAILSDLERFADVSCENSKAIVCLVGESIRGKPGIAARVFSTVAAGNINVRMISQGASEIGIGFVVEDHDAVKTVRRLHDEFFGAGEAEVAAPGLPFEAEAPAALVSGAVAAEQVEEEQR